MALNNHKGWYVIKLQKANNQSKQFNFKQFSLILFQPLDRTLSSATIPGQRGAWSDGNKRVLRIPQCYSITHTSKSDCFVSYPGYLWVGESVYSITPDNWVTRWQSLTSLQRCSRRILQPQPTGRLFERVSPLCRDAVGVFCSPN